MKISRELERPLRVFTTDKEHAKLFIRAVAGEDHCVPSLGVLRHKGAVDTFAFPPRCCVKPTHSSGKYILRRDNEALPLDQIRIWFDHNYYDRFRERNYKNLVPKVIVEPLVFDSTEPAEYKFYCNHGQVKIICVSSATRRGRFYQDFDADWEFLWSWEGDGERPGAIHPRPRNLAAMVQASQAIAQHFALVRVDIYSDGAHFFVGEITHCDGGASSPPQAPSKEKRAAEILLSP